MNWNTNMPARVDHENRRLEIASKAMKLFSQVGYDNVSLLMVASAAGVARTVLYRYFRSKREVFDAAILAATRRIMGDCRKVMASRGSVSDRLSMVCFRVTDMLFEERDFLAAIFDFVMSMVRKGEDMRGRITQFTFGIKDAFRAMVTEGVMKGEFSAQADPERVTEGLFCILESSVLRIVLGTESSSANIKVHFADMVKALSAHSEN
jgi:AcrR family transcriptional regulator